MNRRQALQLVAAFPAAAWGTSVAAATPPRTPMGLVIHSFVTRGARPLPPEYPALNDPIAFAEAASAFGAAGVQIRIGIRDDEYLARLRSIAEQNEIYLEGIVALPKDESDLSRFNEELRISKAAGARVLRTACMSGRRYEVFEKAEQFRQFVGQATRMLTLAEPIARKHAIQLAIENHKDWRVEELLACLKRISSEHVGICLDTGNSIALLEDPHQVVEAYAPWTMTTHMKDMGVADYDEGFLLSEVPLGEGFLDIPRMVATIRKAKPNVRLNLEMLTRDPLKVPCLTQKYWATFEPLPARDLANIMAIVKRQKTTNGLPMISPLDHREQLKVEADNIVKSFAYARDKLAS